MDCYQYCDNCNSPMPGPWELETKHMLMVVANILDGIECKHCNTVNYYYVDSLVDELAERIDK